jgi:peptide/nickel transport system permease protein
MAGKTQTDTLAEAPLLKGGNTAGLFNKLRRNPVLPLFFMLIFIVSALIADYISPYSPTAISLSKKLAPPFWQEGGSSSYLLGTDALGRDILSRIIYGGRASLVVALLSLLFGGMGGGLLGLVAGFIGGKIDTLLMRAADAFLALPPILLALVMTVALGPSTKNLVIAITIVLWARYARVIRGEVLSVKEKEFVMLARVAGCSSFRIMLRHIGSNVLNTWVVLLTLQVGWIIIVESSLSFLGAGVPPPNPAWGSMVADGRKYITTAWWVAAFPGLAIMLTVLSFNMLGDWLRDALDPKLRQV